MSTQAPPLSTLYQGPDCNNPAGETIEQLWGEPRRWLILWQYSWGCPLSRFPLYYCNFSIRCHGYFFLFLFIWVWLLFEGGVYFVVKLVDSSDGWNKYMRILQLGLINAGSSTGSLSVLLSAMKTHPRTWTALEIAQWASATLLVCMFVRRTYYYGL